MIDICIYKFLIFREKGRDCGFYLLPEMKMCHQIYFSQKFVLVFEYVVKKFVFFFLFQGLKVNLILTDYSMPGMTGFELLKKIKVGLWCSNLFCFNSCLLWSILCCFLTSLMVNDTFLVEQESSALSKIPVVIMSSEKILARIDRYILFCTSVILFISLSNTSKMSHSMPLY